MEKSSHLLDKAKTIIDCFGGRECFSPLSSDIYSNLMINVSAVPQMFSFREGIVLVLQDLIKRLGYERITVKGPYSELRIVGNLRKQVVAVYLNSNGGQALSDRHCRSVKQYLEEQSPIGTNIIIEEIF